MKLRTHIINHLVKSEDLNHHGTLFAGKTAMWVVESGFIAAASLTHPEHIVCLNIHGMLFKKPIRNGEIVRFESRVVLAGKTRLVSYVKVVNNADDDFLLDGFISFIHVDRQGRPVPHGIVIEATDPEDVALRERAEAL
ncbi:MAG: acyl-CoA thioesterase [Syntrophobacterales bacterium]|nr:acyl-CoA thioesterase [Syntrophobacterales bacterium]HNQ02341.1 hotdog domain-containing protein [Syntrophales bacterium]HNS53349.1 hotdog domain-containing protein [Syntrophales bacterium]